MKIRISELKKIIREELEYIIDEIDVWNPDPEQDAKITRDGSGKPPEDTRSCAKKGMIWNKATGGCIPLRGRKS